MKKDFILTDRAEIELILAFRLLDKEEQAFQSQCFRAFTEGRTHKIKPRLRVVPRTSSTPPPIRHAGFIQALESMSDADRRMITTLAKERAFVNVNRNKKSSLQLVVNR